MDRKSYLIPVRDVLYVQNIATSILSVGEIEERGNKVLIKDGWCRVFFNDQNAKIIEVRKKNPHTPLRVQEQKENYSLHIQPYLPIINYGMPGLEILANPFCHR